MQLLDLAFLVVAVTGYNIEVVGDEVIENAGARLRCTPSGAVKDVYWTFKNPNNVNNQGTIFAWDGESGGGIKPTYTSKWSNPPNTYDIVINRATRTDNGTYTCMVIFENSEIRTQETNLIVKVPPSKPRLISPKGPSGKKGKTEELPETDYKFTLGEPSKLHCHSSDGIPKPEITWEKCENQNGNCISLPSTASSNTRVFGNSTFKLVNDSSTGDLTVQFNPVRHIDQGYYRCIAQNQAGSVKSEIFHIEFATTISVMVIVGIIFGVLLGLGLISAGAFFLIKHLEANKDEKDKENEENGNNLNQNPFQRQLSERVALRKDSF